MDVRDLINALLDMPMDMEIAVGMPRADGKGLDCYAINTADIGEVDGEDLVILSYEEPVVDRRNIN